MIKSQRFVLADGTAYEWKYYEHIKSSRDCWEWVQRGTDVPPRPDLLPTLTELFIQRCKERFVAGLEERGRERLGGILQAMGVSEAEIPQILDFYPVSAISGEPIFECRDCKQQVTKPNFYFPSGRCNGCHEQFIRTARTRNRKNPNFGGYSN